MRVKLQRMDTTRSWKKNVWELGIFGSSPLFDQTLHVGCPNIGNRQILLERLSDILDRKWFTNDGQYVREFEARVARDVGVKHCIAMCNGTIALEIAIRALELRGEVIIPSCTFVATAHALQWTGVTPVFCDINPDTYTIDPLEIEQLITPLTSGIIGVHLWGHICDVEGLQEVADRFGLKLMYDAAHAFGCSYNGAMVGNFGELEVYSFHATKFVNSFEGGAIVTNNDSLAERIRLMKNFGFAGMDCVSHLGTNGKMSEVSAAMGITSLESKDTFVEANRRNYDLYRELLSDVSGISVIKYNDNEQCNYQYVVLEVDEALSGISRDDLVSILHAENILARRYFYPGCHNVEPYRSSEHHLRVAVPHTDALLHRVMSLPSGSSVTHSDIAKICGLISFVVMHSQEINEARIFEESPKLTVAL